MPRVRLLILLALLPVVALAADRTKGKRHTYTDEYDGYFRKYTKRYFGPNIDWHWFKAQGIAESNLRPHVSSSVGAKGIMQILPSTYVEIKDQNPYFVHIDQPRWNIAAGIFYDRLMYRKWHKKVPRKERLSFTFASYNAGYGTISKARRRAERQGRSPQQWHGVAPSAPGETRNYVARIEAVKKNLP